MSAFKEWLNERRTAWIAEKIGCTQNTVRNWRKTGRVSTQYRQAVLELTGLPPNCVQQQATRGPKCEHAASRAKAFAVLYSQGYTLQEIGARYSITRERVRQVLAKQGIHGEDGGQAQKGRLKRQATKLSRNQRLIDRYGISYAEWKTFTTTGVLQAFREQKRNALYRGVAWELTFVQWWAIWKESGNWLNRGRGRSGFVMARIRDDGPYAVGNVRIITASQNCAEARYNNPNAKRPVEEQGVYFLYPGYSRPWAAKSGKKLIGLFATKEEAQAARAAALNVHAKNFGRTSTVNSIRNL